MLESIKKNWINILGGVFIFTAVLYLFKLAIDEGWVIPEVRVVIGFVAGLTGLYVGYLQYRGDKILGAELIAGLGSAIIYATFAYAGFSQDILWSDNALLISMGAFTGIICYSGYQMDLRRLSFIAILGGLISPLVLKAPEEQVWILYMYVFILNLVALFLSGKKNWAELRLMSFVVTATIYISYYVYFDPLDWKEPTFYLSSLFVVYFIGLILISVFEKEDFEGLNLYLGLLNAINYVFWSMFIYSSFEVSYAFPTLVVAFFFIGAAFFMFSKNKEALLAPMAYFLIGMLLTAIAGGDLANQFQQGGINHVINASIWLVLLASFYAVCQVKSISVGKDISTLIWIAIFFYWLSVAWTVDWVKWFGVVYIPFLNPGALVWIMLAASGFYISRVYQGLSTLDPENRENGKFRSTSLIMAILSHVVIGGLLTIQIQNTWDAYNLTFIQDHVMMSLSFAVYALTLFLWGAYTDQTPFRIIGSTVLVVTAAKVFLIDLQEASTIYMVLFLLFLGLLTLGIAKVDRMWKHRHVEPEG